MGPAVATTRPMRPVTFLVAALIVAAPAAYMVAAAPHGHALVDRGALPLTAPLPTTVPPGVTLVIGDAMTERVLKHTGWIKDVPFTIKWAQIAGGPGVTEAFHAKVLDVGLGVHIPPIHAVWVGIPVRIIAVVMRADPVGHPLYELATAPRSGINSLADLRGKRIAFSPGQVQGEVVLRTLQSQGLSTKDVTLVELPSTSADIYINALIGGLVDVAPMAPGAAAKHYVANYGDEGARVLRHAPFRDDVTTLYVRQETLEDPGKAAALREYVKIWARAQLWMQAHKEEWTQTYYVKDQHLSNTDAHYVADAAGDRVIPRDWNEVIRLQQSAIDLMAGQMGQKRFDAATLFDRRFEAVGADAWAQAARPPTLAAQ